MSGREISERPVAGPPPRVERGRWRLWIWAVPVAAVVLSGWLLWREFGAGGPTVTVAFPDAQGISATNETPVRCRGVRVGTVASTELADDRGGVLVELKMDAGLEDDLRGGTLFWVERGQLSEGELSQLLSGPHIAMRPGEGEPTRRFEGLLSPPPLEPVGAGTRYSLRAERSEGLAQGRRVLYRGLDAGKVLEVALGEDPETIRVQVFVRAPYDELVRGDTRFYRTGDGGVSTEGGQLSLELPTLLELLSSSVAFDAFGPSIAERAPAGSTFELMASSEEARRAPPRELVRFEVRFPDSVSGLEAGAPVELSGVRVGEVGEVGLEVEDGEVRTPVTLALDPELFGVSGEAALRERLARLVERGLRARIAPGGLVLGAEKVSLELVPDAAPASLDESSFPPLLPSTPAQGLPALMNSAESALDELTAAARSLDELLGGSLDRQESLPSLVRALARAADAVRQLAELLRRRPESILRGRDE